MLVRRAWVCSSMVVPTCEQMLYLRIPVLAGGAVHQLCMHSTACASERSLGQTAYQAPLLPGSERATKLIHLRCNSKHFTKHSLEACLQRLEGENGQ
eukprot:scaffold123453_cov18-Tisochrysis_lutea.AAC.6